MSNKNITPEVAKEIKQLSRKIKPITAIGWLSFVAIFVVVFTVAFTQESTSEFNPWLLVGVGLFGISAVCFVSSKNIKKNLDALINENFVMSEIGDFFTVEKMEKFEHINKSDIENTHLIDGWRKVRGNDYIKGKYKNINFQFSDIYLFYETKDYVGDSVKTQEHRVFKGQWLICDFHIPNTAGLMIREIRRGNYQQSNYSTENLAFNMRYNIQTADKAVAEKILTSEFIEKIVEINDTLQAKLLLYFDENCMHIAIDNGRDLFEVQGKSINESEFDQLREKFKEEMQYLTNIMDILTSNSNLFT